MLFLVEKSLKTQILIQSFPVQAIRKHFISFPLLLCCFSQAWIIGKAFKASCSILTLDPDFSVGCPYFYFHNHLFPLKMDMNGGMIV